MSVDVVSFGETMLRLTTPSNIRLEDTPTLHVYVGGSESNTLACLARLGLGVSWLSALPANPIGRHVDTELRRHGVDTSHVVWAAASSRVGTFYVEEAAQPLGIRLYYDRAHSACAFIDPDKVDYSVIDSARILHLTGIIPALSERTREVYKRFLERARDRHILLSFDVNYRVKLWSPAEAITGIEDACRQAGIMICTYTDAVELWGFTGDPEAVIRQMAQHFAPNDEQKIFVLTLGSEGAAQLRNNEYTQEPIFPTEGTFRFGSGDAFTAGYLYAYLNGPLFQECRAMHPTSALTVGNAFAALKRCIPGDTAIIVPDDIRILLQRQTGTRFR